jgi:hypothetical protein
MGEGNMKASGNARMRLTRLLGVFCVALCAAALALPVGAEPAGQVLTAGGDVLVLRGGQILRLYRGAAIESGDQIHTAAESNVLILFTDSGLVWIRANSDFMIDEYSYAQGGRESAFFSLLKGGARSITGLIGRRTRNNFRLRVAVATIGIRGTDFSVVMCQRDCRDSDGNVAAQGLYGEVIEGRIAVTPFDDRVLEREFGAGEFFHLADERSVPTPLFLPPPFLRSKQDEQARVMEQLGIAVGPGNTGVTPGTTTTGGLTGTVPSLTGSATGVVSPVLAPIGSAVSGITSPIVTSLGSTVSALSSTVLTPIGSAVSAVTSPVLTPIGSAVAAVTSPVVTAVGPVVSAVTPILTPIAAPVVSAVTPIVAPITAPVTSTLPVVAPIAAPVVPPIVTIGTPAVPPITLPGPITTPTTGLPRLPVLGGH